MDTLRELFTYYVQNGSYVLYECWRHFLMSAYGVVFAAVFAIPAGIVTARHGRLSGWVFAVANVIQTVPALAMLAVLMLVMGLGANTVITALFLYSLLPILRNTHTGIINIEHAYLESGKAMGMTKYQVLRMVEVCRLRFPSLWRVFERRSSLPSASRQSAPSSAQAASGI